MSDDDKKITDWSDVSPEVLMKMHDIPEECLCAWRDKPLGELEQAHTRLTMAMHRNRSIAEVDTANMEKMVADLYVYIQFRIEVEGNDDRDLLT